LGIASTAGKSFSTKMGGVACFRWVDNCTLCDRSRYDGAQRDNCRGTYVRERIFRPETCRFAYRNTCDIDSGTTFYGN
jgi:hypothetical protein